MHVLVELMLNGQAFPNRFQPFLVGNPLEIFVILNPQSLISLELGIFQLSYAAPGNMRFYHHLLLLLTPLLDLFYQLYRLG